MKQLYGWPESPEQRPTAANIAQAFEDLIGKAGPNTQFLIVLCGHGMQVPIPENQDPLDPKNPEYEDGMDEVFLPADARRSDKGLENVITDNQIGAWLDRMQAKAPTSGSSSITAIPAP